MFRLLRFAELHGIFGTVPSSRKEPQSASSLVFKNTPLSDTLRSDHELSQKGLVGMVFTLGLMHSCVKIAAVKAMMPGVRGSV